MNSLSYVYPGKEKIILLIDYQDVEVDESGPVSSTLSVASFIPISGTSHLLEGLREPQKFAHFTLPALPGKFIL